MPDASPTYAQTEFGPVHVGDEVEVPLAWKGYKRVWAVITEINGEWLRFTGHPDVVAIKAALVLNIRHKDV